MQAKRFPYNPLNPVSFNSTLNLTMYTYTQAVKTEIVSAINQSKAIAV